jgi:hypothetical protein
MITERDRLIIRLANEYRLITTEHLKELSRYEEFKDLGSPETLWRPLTKLVEAKLLYVNERSNTQHNVYATYNISHRNPNNFDHDLLISDTHLAFYKTGFLESWYQNPQKKKGRVNQDASPILKVPTPKGEARLRYFAEADNDTEKDWQIEERMQRYLDIYEKSLEGKKPRVIFVAISASRMNKLLSIAQKKVPQAKTEIFLFTAIQQLKSDPLGSVCKVAHKNEQQSIIPSTA